MSETPVFQSRRQRREAEKREVPTASRNQSIFEESTMTSSRRAVNEPEIFLEPVRPANFGSTSNLGTEPVTASIILDRVPGFESNPIVLTGPGETVTTGSIEIPTAHPTTGTITIINEGEQADEAVVEDSLNSFVSSVAPIRAAGIAKTRSKTVELTLVTRKGQGQVYAVMSTAVLMITVGALIVAAFMLGIF
jgi:hypothetical protein